MVNLNSTSSANLHLNISAFGGLVFVLSGMFPPAIAFSLALVAVAALTKM